MNTFTVEIGGREYLLYKRSTQLVIDALGMQAFALTNDADETSTPEKIIAGVGVVRNILQKAMINPALSDEPGEDRVSWYEIGDAAYKLYEAVMGENFTESPGADATP